MGQLNAGARTLRVDELGYALERGNVVVLPDAVIGGGDTALRRDGGSLKGDQACATLSTCAEMDEMPIVGEAVLRGVLAHGRDSDAIGEGDGAKLKGREKRMAHGLLDEVKGMGMQVGDSKRRRFEEDFVPALRGGAIRVQLCPRVTLRLTLGYFRVLPPGE